MVIDDSRLTVVELNSTAVISNELSSTNFVSFFRNKQAMIALFIESHVTILF